MMNDIVPVTSNFHLRGRHPHAISCGSRKLCPFILSFLASIIVAVKYQIAICFVLRSKEYTLSKSMQENHAHVNVIPLKNTLFLNCELH
jgi:hypothetical protein